MALSENYRPETIGRSDCRPIVRLSADTIVRWDYRPNPRLHSFLLRRLYASPSTGLRWRRPSAIFNTQKQKCDKLAVLQCVITCLRCALSTGNTGNDQWLSRLHQRLRRLHLCQLAHTSHSEQTAFIPLLRF